VISRLTAAVALIVVAGCAAPPPAAAVPAADIEIQNIAYTPSAVTIKIGQTVRWTFDDGGILHHVTGDDGMNSPIVGSGTYIHTFEHAGIYAFHCSIHPMMTGTVTVTS
jgi:plastocyanin